MSKPDNPPALPHIRKLGRYLFYLPCAFGFAMLLAVWLAKAGFSDWFVKETVGPIAIIAFLVLRDLEKNAEVRAMLAERERNQ